MKKIILSIFILLPLFSFAASTDYTLLEPLPCIQNTGQGTTDKACAEGKMLTKINTNTYIAYVFNFSIAFASVAAVLVIIIEGFKYAVSGVAGVKSNAKERIEQALLGIVSILCSYLILKTIDPRLVDINTQLDPIEITGKAFDYDALVNTATDYKIKEDLKTANEQAKPLEAQVAVLRKAADEADSEEKSIELRTEALKLERQANLIRYEAVAEAQYDMGNELLGRIPSTGLLEGQKTEVDLRKASIRDTINEDIQKLKNNGDIEGAAKLSDKRDYYLARFDQSVYLIPKIKEANNIVKFSIKGDTDPNVTKIINEIESYRLPNTLSEESNNLLAKERQEVVAGLKELLKKK